MKTAKADAAPSYLAAEGRAFFERVTEEFELDAPALQTLALACKQLDRIAEARSVLQREPVVVPDRFGFPKTHPAVEVERNAAVAFARLMRELALDVDPPADVRPPRRPGT